MSVITWTWRLAFSIHLIKSSYLLESDNRAIAKPLTELVTDLYIYTEKTQSPHQPKGHSSHSEFQIHVKLPHRDNSEGRNRPAKTPKLIQDFKL